MRDRAPVRVRLRRVKGWRMPPNTVSVARPSRWGNPFRVEHYGRREAVDLYRLCLDVWEMHGDVRNALRGKNLACWCPPDRPCHADVLLEIANAE